MSDRLSQGDGEPGIADLLSRVVGDAEQVARAEIDLQKARLLAKVDQLKSGVIYVVAALLLASLASTALVVGALMILAPLIGPGGATAVVAGTLIVAAGTLGWLAVRHFKRLAASARPMA